MNVKGGLFNWAALKNPAYAVYCISGAATFLGLYTGGFPLVQPHWFNVPGGGRMFVRLTRVGIVLTYIPISAVQVGVSNDFGFYLVAIANGTSAFGRIAAGLLADRVGECRPEGRGQTTDFDADLHGQAQSISWLRLLL